jgi:hypothetical protein
MVTIEVQLAHYKLNLTFDVLMSHKNMKYYSLFQKRNIEYFFILWKTTFNNCEAPVLIWLGYVCVGLCFEKKLIMNQ